jgi:hypothetical protein
MPATRFKPIKMCLPAKQFAGLDCDGFEHAVTELKAAILNGNDVARLTVDQYVNHVFQFLFLVTHKLSDTP